jgi:hypothetical protein
MSNNILLNEFNKLKRKMSNGCNTYGSFSSYKHQNIINNDGFVIEKHINIKNIHHLNNSPNIKFLKSGIFVINLIMYLSENAKIAFYNNGNLLEKTITSINVGTNNICIHEIFVFNEADVLSIRNYNSEPIETCYKINNICKNLDLTIWKIGEFNDDDSSQEESDGEDGNDSEESSDEDLEKNNKLNDDDLSKKSADNYQST